jgi:hypothetical protein
MSRAFFARVAAVVWLAVGCAAPPPESERVDESIVITKHAPSIDFGSYQTYYLRPQILELDKDEDEDGRPDFVEDDTAEPLLEQTRKNLEARGYVPANAPEEADLGVQMMYADKITTASWCYYWWDPYYWGYPGWGYYPYYGCDYSAWQSSMLGTVLVDLQKAREDGTGAGGEGGVGPQDLLPGIWFSGVYGASISSAEYRQGIDQAFKQSPYLRAD